MFRGPREVHVSTFPFLKVIVTVFDTLAEVRFDT
jgi:hypothetical protein